MKTTDFSARLYMKSSIVAVFAGKHVNYFTILYDKKIVQHPGDYKV